jgi:hypothetical protein
MDDFQTSLREIETEECQLKELPTETLEDNVFAELGLGREASAFWREAGKTSLPSGAI